MRILISGGCKNGKSTLAQQIAAAQGEKRVYVATMRARDEEDLRRIGRHRAEREGWGFETVECPCGVDRLIGRLAPKTSLLLDSVTALLAEVMFGEGGGMDPGAGERVLSQLCALSNAFARIVLVSDGIYSDARRFDEATENYRRALAAIERALAARCDGVVERVFGQSILHKGGERVAELLEKAASGLWDGDGAVHGAAGPDPMA